MVALTGTYMLRYRTGEDHARTLLGDVKKLLQTECCVEHARTRRLGNKNKHRSQEHDDNVLRSSVNKGKSKPPNGKALKIMSRILGEMLCVLFVRQQCQLC